MAKQTEALLVGVGYDAKMIDHTEQPSVKIIVNGKYVARVIEGCNAISVIVLFVAFIVSFSDTFKRTALYILAGSTLIYAINLIRIAVLSVAIYHYPEYQETLHSVFFPLVIYGVMFLLWMYWVNHFSKKHKKNV